jgi:hypothetical protein
MSGALHHIKNNEPRRLASHGTSGMSPSEQRRINEQRAC